MEKVFNFRDLGGIPASDGRKVVCGTFYRSGFLDNATESDVKYLKSLGIKKIFDYRDVDEVDNNREIVYQRIGAKHLHYPNNIKKGMVYKLQTGGLNRALIKIKPSDVQEFYSYLSFDNVGYKSMIEALRNDDVPFLQHCTAGKDRAGVGCAILLTVLGVPYDEVVRDYMESIKIRDNIRNLIFDRIPKIFHRFLKDNYEPLFIVDKSYLDAAFNAIDEKYGNFGNYILSEYGLDEEEVKRLRDKYTE